MHTSQSYGVKMIWLKILKDLIAILREGQTPKQIAWGFALGIIVGLSPTFTLQGIIVWLIILTIDINMAAAILSFTLFSLFAYLFDPLFHSLGFWILTQIDPLYGTYTTMYNMPLAPLTRFNNTVVMGSFVIAILLLAPAYFSMRFFIIRYREKIYSRLKNKKWFKVVKNSLIVRYYQKVKDFGGLQ